MVIFKFKNNQTDEGYARTKRLMKSGVKREMVLLPNDIDVEVIGDNGYQIWTKAEYIKYISFRGKVSKEIIDMKWRRVSKGYNFVIAIYREDIKNYNLLSVEYFNRLFDEKNKEATVARIKEEDIKIKDISLESNSIRTDSGIAAFVIAGVRVNFEYSKLKADIFIETDRVLTIEEIKQKIINNDFRKPKDVKEDM